MSPEISVARDAGAGPQPSSSQYPESPRHIECQEYSGRQIADLLCPDHEIVPTNLSANYLSTN